ncbi:MULTISPECIES: site-2 protease family protein [unclassified Ornithinimicrobium]|uniref:site-2 protease family protein n=1 Tax=unclassified Ornithinimicrobium TaxID=2615080 RepID=UPI0038528D8C
MTSTSRGWRIGTLSGIPIYLGRSWVLVAVLMMVLFGPTVEVAEPRLGPWSYLVALVFAVLLLVSVLAHEAAHALVAQRVGYQVSRMVADFWGGHTAHDGAGGTPGRSAAVAVVGPLANGALALLGWWLMGVVPDGVPSLLAFAFMWANAFVAVFNLVPGLPLDGGFLLEALVWRLSGNRHLGTLVAGWMGRLLVVLLALWAVAPTVLEGEQVSISRVLWVGLIGMFLWQGASQAVVAGRHGLTVSRRRLGDAVTEVGVVPAAAFVSSVAWGSRPLWVVLDESGRLDGIVDPKSLQGVPAPAWMTTQVSAVAVRLPSGWVLQAQADDPLEDALAVMRSTGSGVVGLVDEQGRPWGAVLVGDMLASGPRSARS